MTTANGEHVVGNVSSVPSAVLAKPGQSEVSYGRGEANADEHFAIVQVYTLPVGSGCSSDATRRSGIAFAP